MVARSRSKAVGAQANVRIAVAGQVDLESQVIFGSTRDEHSAEFTRPIQTVLGYYQTVLTQIQPPQ